MVDSFAKLVEEVLLWQILEFVYPCVDRGSTVVVYTSFIAEDARLHVVKVILTALFEFGIIAFLLKLLRFEIVTRIVFIADGQRDNIQLLQISSHGKHFQDGILCAVVAVFSPSFALCYPDVFLFLVDSKMDVPAHQLAGAKHFFRG